MEKLVMAYFVCIFFGNILMAHEYAKLGFLEFGLAKPPKAILGFFVGMLAILLGGIYHKFNPAFNPDPTLQNVLVILGIPIAWVIVLRYIILPKGVFDYNRARARLNHWMLSNLSLGTVLEENGKRLREFSRAQDTIRLFERAIEAQSRGVARRMFEYNATLDEERRSYDYGYFFNCPVCGKQLSFPDVEGEALSAYCNVCLSTIHGRKRGDTMHMTVEASQGSRQITDGNKMNMAVAHGELGLLYRKMNRFDDAIDSFKTSLAGIERLLLKNPTDRNYLAAKSLSTFRLAEAYYVKGEKDKARALYNESLEIDRGLGDENGVHSIRRLLGKLA